MPLTNVFDEATLAKFAASQQLAYRAVREVATVLDEGITERETARLLRDWLADHGVIDCFHVPFAWFGSRTAFAGFRSPREFFPTDRRLDAGMPFILDVAPVVDGAPSDVGYTSSLGPNAAVEQLLDDLIDHRNLILQLVRDRRTFADIYVEVDRLAARQGYVNRHTAYPGHVLGHKVEFDPPGRSGRYVVGFGTRHLRSLARSIVEGARDGWSPAWSGARGSAHPPVPGLWAIEPHLGLRNVGAKFEELLVITEDDAFWLDDEVPHVQRARSRALSSADVTTQQAAGVPA